ncbi:MAG TPA: MarR family transcriptional regulator [Phototrophicaceae bacterium]|nr:MarR family transcriptional regulator [Phototrophicaceae bacterium]
MDDSSELIEQILRLDIMLQRQVYAGWPATWVQVKWPVGETRALLLIASGYADSPGQIAALLNVSRTTMTGILDRLENDHLISRRIDPEDRRRFVLEPTPEGQELVRQIDSWRLGQLREALEMLDSESLRALQQGLAALTKAMDIRSERVTEGIGEEEA